MQNSRMKIRAIEIAYELQLSHIGSTLSAIDIINQIFSIKQDKDIFVLDNGHAYLAQCVVMENRGMGNAKAMYEHHGTHPDKCDLCGNVVSSGSLGLAGSIAAGMAYGAKNDVYVLTSDGALAEGIWYETLNFLREKRIKNYKLYINANGFGAYREIRLVDLKSLIEHWRDGVDISLWDTSYEMSQYMPILDGMEAHYKKINESEKNLLIKYLQRGYSGETY